MLPLINTSFRHGGHYRNISYDENIEHEKLSTTISKLKEDLDVQIDKHAHSEQKHAHLEEELRKKDQTCKAPTEENEAPEESSKGAKEEAFRQAELLHLLMDKGLQKGKKDTESKHVKEEIKHGQKYTSISAYQHTSHCLNI